MPPIYALDSFESDWFTPESCEGDENPTRFKLKPLPGRHHLRVSCGIIVSRSGNIEVKPEAMEFAIQLGLVGWENFTTKDGREITFNRKNIDKVPGEILQEIAYEVIERSGITEEKEKN